MKQKLLFILSFFLSAQCFADGVIRDSVMVEEVKVGAPRRKYFIEGYNYHEIPENQLNQFANRSLGEILQSLGGVNVRSNGTPGLLSSVSIRGLGSSETQINWNGFPINSVTLGSADLSNIPLTMGQTVGVAAGGSGASYGSGSIGGAINLDWEGGTSDVPNFVVNLAAGSMSTYKGAVGYHVGGNKLILSGNVWGDMSDGDFKYYDEFKQKEFNREHADYHQVGIQQYFSYKYSPTSELKGGIWAQAKDLNLPSLESASLENSENQKDSSLRVFLHYKKVFSNCVLDAKGAWFYADQLYTKIGIPDSRIKSKTWFGDANYRKYLPYHLSFDLGVTYQNTTAIVDAYEGVKNENVFGLIPGIKFNYKGLKVSWQVRKDWANTTNSDFLNNLGIDYQLIKNVLSVRGAYSEKFKRPTFNDLFWVPGGDPNLDPENGYSIETGATYFLKTNHIGDFSFDLAWYYSPFKNMIVWRPEGATWYAKNYRDVLSRGVDFKINHVSKTKSFDWTNQLTIGYNKATVESATDGRNEGRPLYYAPEWIGSFNSAIQNYKGWSLAVNVHTVSKRYYDDTKSYLDPYRLLGANLSKSIDFGKNSLTAMLNVDNILNERYQTVRSYPMPGRIWLINLKYSFNK